MSNQKDIEFMNLAIDLAEKALENGNEPFGAILVKDNKVVYTNENQINSKTDPTYHAEMGLIRDFCQETGITNLKEYTLYSSCEPCYMCSGGMVWAELGRLVYAASDIDLEGLIGGIPKEPSKKVFKTSHHKPEVTPYVLRQRGVEVLARHFDTSFYKK